MLQVQAHGGGLLKVKDTWYWYGESYKRPLLNDFLSEGVNLYSSSGKDQPCTYLLPHMRPRSCRGQPCTLHDGGLSSPRIWHTTFTSALSQLLLPFLFKG